MLNSKYKLKKEYLGVAKDTPLLVRIDTYYDLKTTDPAPVTLSSISSTDILNLVDNDIVVAITDDIVGNYVVYGTTYRLNSEYLGMPVGTILEKRDEVFYVLQKEGVTVLSIPQADYQKFIDQEVIYDSTAIVEKYSLKKDFLGYTGYTTKLTVATGYTGTVNATGFTGFTGYTSFPNSYTSYVGYTGITSYTSFTGYTSFLDTINYTGYTSYTGFTSFYGVYGASGIVNTYKVTVPTPDGPTESIITFTDADIKIIEKWKAMNLIFDNTIENPEYQFKKGYIAEGGTTGATAFQQGEDLLTYLDYAESVKMHRVVADGNTVDSPKSKMIISQSKVDEFVANGILEKIDDKKWTDGELVEIIDYINKKLNIVRDRSVYFTRLQDYKTANNIT